jgi:hypothetical protein
VGFHHRFNAFTLPGKDPGKDPTDLLAQDAKK